METIRIAITDDHPMMLSGLKHALETYGHIRVTDLYPNGQALLDGLQKNIPDVLLLDVHLPDIPGDELTRIITRKYPSVNILILTSHDSIFFIRSLLRSGATGYVLKNAENKIILEAIENVYHGLQFLSPEVKDTLVKDTLKMRSKISNHFELTDREKDILRLIAEEYTSQEIADKLFLSQRTVENYRLGLMQKLDAKNMVGMIRKAMQMGLVE
jgi:DNA-binding NarL/FixJ family response regulator